MPGEGRYQDRIELLQGTLDLIILQTLRWGPQHGYGISHAINAASRDAFKVETGSLYPALHRLEKRGWIASEWKTSDKKQRAKYYRLTTSRPATTRERAIALGAIRRCYGCTDEAEKNLERGFSTMVRHGGSLRGFDDGSKRWFQEPCRTLAENQREEPAFKNHRGEPSWRTIVENHRKNRREEPS